MRRFFWLGGLAALLGCSAPEALVDETEASNAVQPPNILLIVADDLGFTDLGSFGGEIATPHLDGLARAGVRLTNFRTGPSCAPTRAMLMTGTDNHLAGMGSQSNATENQRVSPAYGNQLLPSMPTIAEQLGALGYRSVASTKWHLGTDANALPNARGFERSLVLLEGGAGHFDATPIFAHYEASWLEDDQPVALPDDFYSTDFMTDKVIAYIGETPTDVPYFAYLGFTAPHWPLQAPASDIETYRGRYDAGWHALFDARMAGAIREGVVEPDHVGVSHEPGVEEWSSIDADQRAVELAKMETYSAMVDRLDQNVGRLLTFLTERGDLDNTVIVFMADNGAEAHRMEFYGGNDEWVPANFDNAVEKIGTKDSYVTLGPSWARATAAPFRDSKSKVAEGGIRVPAFFVLPDGSPGIDRSFMRVMDLAPTFLDIAGGSSDPDKMGRSLLARFNGGPPAYAADEAIAGETFNRRYVYRGDWKLLYQEPPYGTSEWQLYNLVDDPGEQNDVAAANPELVRELIAAYDDYATKVGVIVPETPIAY